MFFIEYDEMCDLNDVLNFYRTTHIDTWQDALIINFPFVSKFVWHEFPLVIDSTTTRVVHTYHSESLKSITTYLDPSQWMLKHRNINICLNIWWLFDLYCDSTREENKHTHTHSLLQQINGVINYGEHLVRKRVNDSRKLILIKQYFVCCVCPQ